MSKMPKCLIVDDELSSRLGDTLRTFSDLNRPEIFRFLLLSDEKNVQLAEQQFSEFAVVEPYSRRHENLPAYLAANLKPRDLVVIDIRLNKHFNEMIDGPTALLKALLELLDKRQLDEFRNGLRVAFVTQYPAEIIRLFDSVQKVIRNLDHPVTVIEKVGDFHSKLRDTIDAWRVEIGLFGAGPGPLLSDYLSGDREVYINFQPIVNLRTGHIYSYEVLARDTMERGLFPEAAFQDAYGLGGDWPQKINMLVFEKFLDWVAGADEVYKHLLYSLNASPSTLISDAFDEKFLNISSARNLPIDCQNIGFEILEREVARFEESALLRTRRQLRSLGYRFEIDDYGTGSAAAERLMRLKPDIVKLDRSFVEQFCKGSDPTGTGKSLSQWARVNNVMLVAEGVDSSFDARELSLLIEAGFILAQGYLFGGASPTPARKVLKEGTRIIKEIDSLKETQEMVAVRFEDLTLHPEDLK